MKKLLAGLLLLLAPSVHAIDQGYTNFKSSINVNGLMTGTTVQVSGQIKFRDGTTITSTTTLPGGLTLGTTNGLSLSGNTLSLTTATTNRTGALNSIDFTTFNNKLSTTSAASTYLTQSSAAATYLSQSSAAATYQPVGSYLTTSSATATYLQQTTASDTYLTKSSATATYFQPADATTTNLPEGSNLYFTTARSTSSISAPSPLTYANGVVGVDGSSVTLQGNTFNTGSRLLQLSGGLIPNSLVDGSSVTKAGVLVAGGNITLTPGAGFTTISSTADVSAFLTTSSATATYLQQTDAANTYLTKSSASVTYDNVNSQIAASRIAAGSLGASVIASSIAVNAVTNESIVSLSGAKITGTGSIPNAAIDGSSITKQGNTFNTGSNLLQLSGGLVPNANVDGSSVTKQGNSFNAASQLLQLDGSALVPNANIATSSITKQGNSFNGASQLLQLNSSSLVPNANIDSSSVTKYGASIPAAAIAAGSLGSSVIASSIAVSGVTAGSYGSATQVPGYTVGGDGRLTAASNTTISLTNSNLQSGTYSNVTVPAANVAAGSLGTSVIASSIAVSAVQDASIVGVSASKLAGTGTLPNAVVDGSSVTKQGNTFNGANQLLQLNSATGFSLAASTITSLQNTTITNAGVRTITNSANGVQILGANDNTLANQFDVGWTTFSALSRSAAVAVTANSATSVSTITLQAGQYLLGGSIGWRTGGTTTAFYGCMNTTPNSIGVGDFENNFLNGQGCVPVEGVAILAAKDYGFALPMSQASFNSQTTVYLTQLSDGTSNKPSGTIFAIRIH